MKPREMEVKTKETNTSILYQAGIHWRPGRSLAPLWPPFIQLLCFEEPLRESLVISCFPECPRGSASQRSVNIHNAAEWETEVALRDHYWAAVGTESCAILKHTFSCNSVRVHFLQPLMSVIKGVNQFFGMSGYYFFSWNGAQLTFCENT